MLTAESEGGQRKCHPYWVPGNYGPWKLQALGEKRSSLETIKQRPPFTKIDPSRTSGSGTTERPGPGRRRSTAHTNTSVSAQSSPSPQFIPNDENPHVIIRKLALSHTGYPSEPTREITQLQYTSWPDFGAPARPAHVLGLVEHCNEVVRNYDSDRAVHEPAGLGERPVVVHCSAGCGRTGTFCTVDSVVDMLKRQRVERLKSARAEPMDVDSRKSEHRDDGDMAWFGNDEIDLVAKTVQDFRLQRLSMVQTLRQFVLCYETILEWMASEMSDDMLMTRDPGDFRRSYYG